MLSRGWRQITRQDEVLRERERIHQLITDALAPGTELLQDDRDSLDQWCLRSARMHVQAAALDDVLRLVPVTFALGHLGAVIVLRPVGVAPDYALVLATASAFIAGVLLYLVLALSAGIAALGVPAQCAIGSIIVFGDLLHRPTTDRPFVDQVLALGIATWAVVCLGSVGLYMIGALAKRRLRPSDLDARAQADLAFFRALVPVLDYVASTPAGSWSARTTSVELSSRLCRLADAAAGLRSRSDNSREKRRKRHGVQCHRLADWFLDRAEWFDSPMSDSLLTLARELSGVVEDFIKTPHALLARGADVDNRRRRGRGTRMARRTMPVFVLALLVAASLVLHSLSGVPDGIRAAVDGVIVGWIATLRPPQVR